VTFLASYAIPKEFEFTEEELKKYGATSALPMVYPYFREVLHNTASRAGYPGMLLSPMVNYAQPRSPAIDIPSVQQ
jgi:preprotein translocase subunit SecB